MDTRSPGTVASSELAGAEPSGAVPRSIRILAFSLICLGGIIGAVIGNSYARLSCTGSCETTAGLFLFIGAVLGAAGVAVVAGLTLRAFAEWRHTVGGGTSQPAK